MMDHWYKQSDSKWGNLKIGKTNLTMAKYGCYITSIAMLVDRNPLELLELFNKNNVFTIDGCLKNDVAAKLLGKIYTKTINCPNELCIAETDHYKSKGWSQHFFIWCNSNNYIVDPLTGTKIQNKYHIVSYRLFK